METWCSMTGCFNSSTNTQSVQFYNFPRSFDLCWLWVQNCERTELTDEFAYGGAQPFVNKVVCSKHFSNSSFIDFNCLSKGIKSDAVPKLFPEQPDFVFVKSEIPDPDDSTDFLEENVYPEDNVNVFTNYIKEETPDTCLTDNGSTQDGTETEESVNDDLLPLLMVAREELYLENNGKNTSFKTGQQRNQTNTNAFRNACKRANETEDERKTRNETNAERNATRRANESKDELADRLYKNAIRAAIRRGMESEEQQQERRRKNALRAAFRRSNESEEQRAERRLKDKIRSAERRKQESDVQSKIRKYNDAIRAAFRRSHESEEQRQQRRMFDVLRAARKRSNETDEQRSKRLQADRERAAKRRMLKKLKQDIERFEYNIGLQSTISDDAPGVFNESLMEETNFSESSVSSSNDKSNSYRPEASTDKSGAGGSLTNFVNIALCE